VNIRHVWLLGLWFRFYSEEPFPGAEKVPPKGLPLHTGPRWGEDCPRSGVAPGVAARGRPWPRAANSASCLVTPCATPPLGLLEKGPCRNSVVNSHKIPADQNRCRRCLLQGICGASTSVGRSTTYSRHQTRSYCSSRIGCSCAAIPRASNPVRHNADRQHQG
jgi:hypothetical protein